MNVSWEAFVFSVEAPPGDRRWVGSREEEEDAMVSGDVESSRSAVVGKVFRSSSV